MLDQETEGMGGTQVFLISGYLSPTAETEASFGYDVENTTQEMQSPGKCSSL